MTNETCKGISVMLTAADMTAALPFYRDKLGFTLEESWPNADDPQWANLVLEGQSVMLGRNPDPDKAGQMCGDDQRAIEWYTGTASDFRDNSPGAGVIVYLQVPDIDAYHKELVARGLDVPEPKTQFYGIREVTLQDPTGYRLIFHTPVTMDSCQSCGMPLAEASPGDMYCEHCTDESGQLRAYEQVLEGTVTGYFMGMQKMERAEAEAAAVEHLTRMPAWSSRKGS